MLIFVRVTLALVESITNVYFYLMISIVPVFPS